MFDWIGRIRRAVQWKHRGTNARAARRSRERTEVARFCARVITPSLQDLTVELERLGRRVSVCRQSTIFHMTVWHDRMVEFQYSVSACRRRRPARSAQFVHPQATVYRVEPQRVYQLSEIRRTDRHKFARQLAEAYQRSLTVRPASRR